MNITPRISRRSFLKLCAASGAAGLLAACGKRIPAPSTTAPEPTRKSASKESRLWPGWNRGDVYRDRILKIKTDVEGEIICNPLHEMYNTFGGRGLMLEPCAYNAALADKTILWLVDSYRYNQDATELTINFRHDITWSDGTPFSPGDMKFAIDALLRYQDSGQLPAILRKADSLRVVVDEVEIIDETSLVFKLKQTDWRFFHRELTFGLSGQGQPAAIVPSHIFQFLSDPELRNEKFFDEKNNYPVVTGPYLQVKRFQSYFNEYEYAPINQFELLPDWWAVKTGLVDQMPEVERVLMISYKGEKTDAELLASREFDLCDMLDVNDLQKLLFDKPFISTWTGDKPPYGYLLPYSISLGFNCLKPPFDDPKVRWAVAYAIDHETIAKEIWKQYAPGLSPEASTDAQPGIFTPADLIARTPFPPLPGWTKLFEKIDDLVSEYDYTRYDPRQSAQLMQEAGLNRDEQGYWIDQNGVRPDASLFIYTTSNDELAPLVVDQMQQAGFACDKFVLEDAYTTVAQGYAPLFLQWVMSDASDPYLSLIDYRGDAVLPIGKESYSNINRWRNIEFTSILGKMRQNPIEGSEMSALFRQAMEIWYKHLPFLPIHYIYNRFIFNQSYWDNWPTAANPYIEPNMYGPTFLQVVMNLKSKFRDESR